MRTLINGLEFRKQEIRFQVNKLICADSVQFNPVKKNKQGSRSEMRDCCLSVSVLGVW